MVSLHTMQSNGSLQQWELQGKSTSMCRLLDWERRGAELIQARAAMEEELQEAQERVEAEGAAQKDYADKVENLGRELEIMKVELTAAKQNVEKAEFDKNKVCAFHQQHEAIARLVIDRKVGSCCTEN